MTNQEIADLLRMVSAAFEVKDEDFFRVRAYQNAAASIEHATSDLRDIWEEGGLQKLPGVGPNLAQHLDELFKTGKVKHFESEMKGLPEGMFTLLSISGVGPKSAIKLARQLKLDKGGQVALKKVLSAAKKNQILAMEGFGEESQKQIVVAIEQKLQSKGSRERLLLPEAERLAEEVVMYLKNNKAVLEVEVLGSLRRRVATVGDVDLAVKTDKPKEVMEHLKKYPGIKKILSTGDKTTMFIHKSGRQIDVKTQPAKAWGSLLQHYTGSKHHNIALRTFALEKGMSLSEHGIKKAGKLNTYPDEESFYKALGMEWVPPELREDTGEIKAAINKKLPDLVELKDIKGDLQIHTTLAYETSHDAGVSTVTEILDKAEELAYEYVGLTDHNPKLGLSEKKTLETIKRRNEAIEKEVSAREKRVKRKIKVFKGLEVDIRPDGELAISDEALKTLDYALVSIHASFRQSKGEATKRVLAALAHPKVKVWAHPTGRLLNQREGVDVEWEKVFDFCKKKDIAIEVNASAQRLDISDVLVRQAVETGVKLIISTDAHDIRGMEAMKYGVWTARRGWTEKGKVLNTKGVGEFSKWLGV